ncbi:periplasmic heavy metal sensor [Nisaea sp.]|uniref:periplasmic heavy metal sensor n=1 Tax=Nisaea sp. TaxID=2024842 RepID=UPI0032ED2185
MTWTRTRVLALLLFASVSINLFVAGMVVGRWDRWHDGPPGQRHGHSMSRMIERTLGDTLSPEIRDRLRAHSEKMRGTHGAMRENRETVREILLREPFDRNAYLEALDSMNAVFDRMRAETHSFMTEIVEQLTPEQRRKLVESLGRHRPDRKDD